VVQGFNFVLPSAAVKDFLKDAGVTLGEPSKFNAAWHAGLREHFAGNYSRAARHFEEANRLVPELPDVRRITAENEERRKSEPLLPWRTVAVAVLLASAVAYAILTARRWQRNRFRIRPADVARLVESEHPPVILDVRDAPTYAKSPVRIPRSLHVTPEALALGTTPLDVERDRTVVAYCT
jgi:hypothetical protein